MLKIFIVQFHMLPHLENAWEYLSTDGTFTILLVWNIFFERAFAARFHVSVEHAPAGEVLVTLIARMVQPWFNAGVGGLVIFQMFSSRRGKTAVFEWTYETLLVLMCSFMPPEVAGGGKLGLANAAHVLSNLVVNRNMFPQVTEARRFIFTKIARWRLHSLIWLQYELQLSLAILLVDIDFSSKHLLMILFSSFMLFPRKMLTLNIQHFFQHWQMKLLTY